MITGKLNCYSENLKELIGWPDQNGLQVLSLRLWKLYPPARAKRAWLFFLREPNLAFNAPGSEKKKKKMTI